MGTRCITILPGSDGETAVLYRQFDGYPEGHGEELKAFLKGKKMVNGFGGDDTLETTFNGPECLSAALVAHFKTEIGGFYLFPAGTRNVGEDYRYFIRPDLTVDIEEA